MSAMSVYLQNQQSTNTMHCNVTFILCITVDMSVCLATNTCNTHSIMSVMNVHILLQIHVHIYYNICSSMSVTTHGGIK